VLRVIADSLLSVLLAPACASCQRPLDEPIRGPVCQQCWRGIISFTPPLCRRCGDPLPSWRVLSLEAEMCPRCRRRPSVLLECRALGPYDGSLRAIIHALKYDGRRSLAGPLADLIRSDCGNLIAASDLVVPVPLHARRRRERGFNQAEELAVKLGLPCRSVLRRKRATPSQTDLPAARRHANVRDAFSVSRGVSISGLRVLLVDDVCTTGATLEACAQVLKAGGAANVRAVTAARVVSRPRA
jgi:ComF family protein